MNGEEKLIPYKRMRKFLRQETKGTVSKEACVFMQNYMEDFMKEICKEIISEHQRQNELRKFHGLPEHKRIQVSEYIKHLGNEIYQKFHFRTKGEIGKHNGNTILSDKADKEVI